MRRRLRNKNGLVVVLVFIVVVLLVIIVQSKYGINFQKDELISKCSVKLDNWIDVQESKGYNLKINKIEKFEINQKSEAESFYDLWSDIGGGISSSYFRSALNPNEESPIKYPLVLFATTYKNLGTLQHVTLVFVCNKDGDIINSEFN